MCRYRVECYYNTGSIKISQHDTYQDAMSWSTFMSILTHNHKHIHTIALIENNTDRTLKVWAI